jgi:hypothetical protein
MQSTYNSALELDQFIIIIIIIITIILSSSYAEYLQLCTWIKSRF